jgi:hypothetical protein
MWILKELVGMVTGMSEREKMKNRIDTKDCYVYFVCRHCKTAGLNPSCLKVPSRESSTKIHYYDHKLFLVESTRHLSSLVHRKLVVVIPLNPVKWNNV